MKNDKLALAFSSAKVQTLARLETSSLCVRRAKYIVKSSKKISWHLREPTTARTFGNKIPHPNFFYDLGFQIKLC